MIRIVATISLAAACVLSESAVSAQAPTSTSPSTSTADAVASGAATQAMTIQGCVYRVSDESNAFALQRTADAGTTGAQANIRQPGQKPSAVGTSGTTGTAADRSTFVGAWYRMSRANSSDLSEFVGRPVRVTGTLVPGRDANNAEVVIHRVEPANATVTTRDLKPAPHFIVQDITEVAGQCRAK